MCFGYYLNLDLLSKSVHDLSFTWNMIDLIQYFNGQWGKINDRNHGIYNIYNLENETDDEVVILFIGILHNGTIYIFDSGPFVEFINTENMVSKRKKIMDHRIGIKIYDENISDGKENNNNDIKSKNELLLVSSLVIKVYQLIVLSFVTVVFPVVIIKEHHFISIKFADHNDS